MVYIGIDQQMHACLVAQLCLTLFDPMDCSPPGSSVHGDSPGKNTGVGGHALLQGIFPTQGLNPGLPHCRRILYHLSHQESHISQHFTEYVYTCMYTTGFSVTLVLWACGENYLKMCFFYPWLYEDLIDITLCSFKVFSIVVLYTYIL